MELPMEQPFFKIRSVSTSVSIYNGATVVMGGMITEVRSSSDDKIPLLGDIPYLGRLFHSKAEHSEKRNLLIFVTARLVDPAGRAVKTNMEPALSGKKAAELVKLATP
jgi:general secretion pathway protein D